MVTENRERMAGSGEGFDLHVPKEYAGPVASCLRNHINELPTEFRNQLQNQLKTWNISGGGSNVGGAAGQPAPSGR
jgi:hypothetical protein